MSKRWIFKATAGCYLLFGSLFAGEEIVFTDALFSRCVQPYENWMAYGTFQANPYTCIDNPSVNLLGIHGEVSLPYTVPEGYILVIDYLQIEGPDSPQVGMMLWLGSPPCTNRKCVISCTTAGGSAQLNGMSLILAAGKTVNIRVMNNTSLPWVNGFFLQGRLYPVEG